MSEHPLKIIESLDPELFELVQRNHELALEDGVLPKKIKLLMALAVDATIKATGGVRALALQALEAGATKDEIAEALRVAQFIGGVGSVYTAAEALRDVLI
jgi:alkylhydroperoxidase/carboxymuconolactone decarboxylase family protein YurZ